MGQQAFTGKESIGKVNVERFRDSIRLRWSLKGKRYSLTVGRDSRDAIKAARGKAQIIDSDITFDRFDPTLEKYGNQRTTVLEVVSVIPDNQIALKELWNKFLSDKLPHIKAKTKDEYENFTRLLDKLEALGSDALSYDALKTKQNLLSITTNDQTRRILQYLGACCIWGMKHRLITDNPFSGLATDMPKRKSVTDPDPNAFTEAGREVVIQAFKNDKRAGMNYRHYAPIVEFWFLTGCRPSEAIGLTWGNVSDDCSVVIFNGSIQTIRGVQVRSELSKNNKVRSFAISLRVQELLKFRRPVDADPLSLVFPSPKGKAINYPNFLTKVWGKIVDPIKPNTTPYNCRDTFYYASIN